MATQILALHGEGAAEHYNGDYTEYHDWKAKSFGGIGAVQSGSARSRLAEDSGPPVDPGLDRSHSASGEGASGDRSTPLGRRVKGKSVTARVTGGSHQQRRASVAAGGSPGVKVIKKARALETIEAEISQFELRLAELSEEMAKPEVARDITMLVKLNEEYEQAQSRLGELMEEWERAEATR